MGTRDLTIVLETRLQWYRVEGKLGAWSSVLVAVAAAAVMSVSKREIRLSLCLLSDSLK